VPDAALMLGSACGGVPVRTCDKLATRGDLLGGDLVGDEE
jgi:hypothetical protein